MNPATQVSDEGLLLSVMTVAVTLGQLKDRFVDKSF